jgi:hypothetical protein
MLAEEQAQSMSTRVNPAIRCIAFPAPQVDVTQSKAEGWNWLGDPSLRLKIGQSRRFTPELHLVLRYSHKSKAAQPPALTTTGIVSSQSPDGAFVIHSVQAWIQPPSTGNSTPFT